MTNYRRPWWLIVNKPAGLVTTVREEIQPGERIFIVRGEPVVQGLAWLTWGPVGAVLMVLLLAGLAIAFEVQAQGWGARVLFIAAFFILPGLAWIGVAVALARLSEKYLQVERQAETQECVIRLNQQQGELVYQTPAQLQAEKLTYQQIRQAKLTHPIGGRDSRSMRLTLETSQGPVVLLTETLGTSTQKSDLIQEIQQALKSYGT